MKREMEGMNMVKADEDALSIDLIKDKKFSTQQIFSVSRILRNAIIMLIHKKR